MKLGWEKYHSVCKHKQRLVWAGSKPILVMVPLQTVEIIRNREVTTHTRHTNYLSISFSNTKFSLARVQTLSNCIGRGGGEKQLIIRSQLTAMTWHGDLSDDCHRLPVLACLVNCIIIITEIPLNPFNYKKTLRLIKGFRR